MKRIETDNLMIDRIATIPGMYNGVIFLKVMPPHVIYLSKILYNNLFIIVCANPSDPFNPLRVTKLLDPFH
jgi:hypothetical protein